MSNITFSPAAFSDVRIARTAEDLLDRMVRNQKVSLRALAGNRAGEVRFSRFLGNRRVTVPAVLDGAGRHTAETVARTARTAAGLHVLAIQDKTEINYQAQARRKTGLGVVGNASDVGLWVHAVLATAADGDGCLGLIDARIWQRHGRVEVNRRERPIEAKESHHWLEGGWAAKRVLGGRATRVTLIDDPEGDVFAKWAWLPEPGFDLLTRVTQNRRLADGGRLFETLAAQPVAETYTLTLRDQPKRPGRTATLELRFTPVTVARPAHDRDPRLPPSVALSAVEARETTRPAVGEPLHWRLLTTHPVTTVAKAHQIIDWYRQRWHIEQLFRTLKTQGLNLEASQVVYADRLEKLTALALVAATRTLQLTLARDGTLDRPASDALEPEEIAVLHAAQPQLEGRTARQTNPHPPDSLAWAAWLVARLGGWKGYACERPPGPITMLRGLQHLTAMRHGWRLAHDVCIP
jgi:hypothetical protein